MLRVISKMSEALERLKGFSTGYSTESPNKLLVEVEGKVYLLQAKELGEGTVDNYQDVL